MTDGTTSHGNIPVTVNYFPHIINLPAEHRPDSGDDTVIVPDGSAAHPIAAAFLLANDTDADPGDTGLLIVDPNSLTAPLRGSVVVDSVDPTTRRGRPVELPSHR